MALRNEHGKLRPQPPRSKDLPTTLTAGEPLRNRDALGRFTSNNDAATGRGLKQLIKRHLGHETTNAATAELYREVGTLFAGLLRSLPSQAPAVQDMVARHARATAFSARYAARAVEIGLDTDDGRRALEMSIKLDARAERLAISALDIAERLHASAPKESVVERMRRDAAAREDAAKKEPK